ncbi:MAG: 4Fe-4S binding protein [Fibrobacterota bacterium]
MVSVDVSKCDRCGTCIAVCPVMALSMERHLSVDYSACTECRNCVNICPFGALRISTVKDAVHEANYSTR